MQKGINTEHHPSIIKHYLFHHCKYGTSKKIFPSISMEQKRHRKY